SQISSSVSARRFVLQRFLSMASSARATARRRFGSPQIDGASRDETSTLVKRATATAKFSTGYTRANSSRPRAQFFSATCWPPQARDEPPTSEIEGSGAEELCRFWLAPARDHAAGPAFFHRRWSRCLSPP